MPREIITLPSLPNGEESGISLEIVKKKRVPYINSNKVIPTKKISSDSIDIIANQIVNNNLSVHQKKRNDYFNNGIMDIETLGKIIHNNHSSEIHNSIINNSEDISYVKLYYGDNKVRLESNGHIMAIILQCTNAPRKILAPTGWECVKNRNKILLYTDGDNLLNGSITLFNYTTSLRILKAKVIGSKNKVYSVDTYIEGVEYYQYLKGNWETMDSVNWENYKGTF